MSKRKWISLWMALVLAVTSVAGGGFTPSSVSAQSSTEMVTAYIALQGHNATTQAAISKTPVHVEKGTTAAQAVKEVLDASGYEYDMPDTGYGPYLESVKGMGTESAGDSWYYWSFYINGNYSNVGLGGYELQDNDKISLIYNYEDNSTQADDFVDDASKNPTEEQESALIAAGEEQQKVLAKAIWQKYFGDGTIPGIENYANNLYVVFSLLRAGYEAPEFYQKVYEKVEQQLFELQNAGKVTVQQTDSKTGELVDYVITEKEIAEWGTGELFYAKIVLMLSAMGKDATKTGGFNLIEKMASKSLYETCAEQTMRSATMLLALDSSGYALPKNEDSITRTELVNDIVDSYDDSIDTVIAWGGSWGYYVDTPAMLLQALAPYYHQEDNLAAKEGLDTYNQDEIDAVCTKGIRFLESMQESDGSYNSNAWSLAQVMTTMGQFGIKASNEKDGYDFIKNGVTVYDCAAAFVNVEEESVDSELLGWQPEQLLRGLNACLRVSKGEKALYDTTVTSNEKDVPSATPAPGVTPTAPASASPEASQTATKSAIKTIQVKKLTAKKGSKKIKGTLNVTKAKVTVTLKRGSKKVSIPVTVNGKNFTGSLTKASVKKLLGSKAGKKKLQKNMKLKKGDVIVLQATKTGYKKAKKTMKIK
jgi:hypothetical protein